MTIPLSYVLPVHNAERWLTAKVEELLDDLSQDASAFELLIIDDGSFDDTPHIAQQLAMTYPQITLVRRDARYGNSSSIRTALTHARGEKIVMVVDASEDPSRRTLCRIELPTVRASQPIAAPHFAVSASRRTASRRTPSVQSQSD